MKLWYRFVCAFVAVVVVLFSVCVPDVDADEDILTGDKLSLGGFVDDEDGIDNYFYEKFGTSIDDYYYICFGIVGCTEQSNYSGTVVAYIPKSDYLSDCLTVESSLDDNNENYSFTLNLSGFSVISFQGNGTIFTYQSFVKLCFNLRVPLIGVDTGVLKFNNVFFYQSESSYGVQNEGIYTNIDINAGGALNFTYDNDFSVGMDLTALPQQFTLTATNETNNYYNYVFYISSSPASAGVQKSFADSVFIMSSNQWCMKYSWSSLMPDDDVSISDWIKDSFGRVIDPWGNIFNPEQSYMGRHSSGSSDDGIYYYTLSQQKKCPFYLIKPNDSRSHVIPYSALNLSLDTTYYANIIYLDTTDYGVIPSSNSWGAADTSHNNYRSHPLYNLNLISRFSVYSSTEFSVTSGNFTKDDDGLYDYKDVVDNSNPASSSATISSEDNSVSINNANNYDNSSSVSYINYGTIYHNCSWSGSGGSSSGARPSVPELPDAEFKDLYEQSGNFFDFVADVLDSVGAVPMLFITAAFAVLLFLRIWGR